MGELLGIPQNTYANYESGSRKLPAEVQKKLGNLGLNLNWLATGSGSMMVAGVVNASDHVERGYRLSPEVFEAIQNASQLMENLIRGVPLDLRAGIDIPQMGFYLAQMVDHLLAGEQEKILEMQAHFLSQIPRLSKQSRNPAK
ncbi:MAG: helix-turn-helix domain-containing protein [Fibrobacterota bacterium]|nr:helix-turn-helix domain-containing protein [Fibrobacterota bacterium]